MQPNTFRGMVIGSRYAVQMAKPTRSPMKFDREKLVSVRLNTEEHAVLSEQADLIGLKLSQYLRVAALEKARREREKGRSG
jgi:hypothetical protein